MRASQAQPRLEASVPAPAPRAVGSRSTDLESSSVFSYPLTQKGRVLIKFPPD